VLGTGRVAVVLVHRSLGIARGFFGTDGFVFGGYVEPWFNVVPWLHIRCLCQRCTVGLPYPLV